MDVREHRLSTLLFSWMKLTDRACFILNDNLAISWQNNFANELIAAGDLSTGDKLKLVLGDSQEQEKFRKFVGQSNDKVSRHCLPYPENDHLLCTTILISEATTRATGVTLRRASRVMSIGAEALGAAFQLTPSERRVIDALFSGNTPEQIGELLKLSIGTVRAHVKHIYEKLDVRSREAMFHKVLPYMIVG